jgi:hypothetical protein
MAASASLGRVLLAARSSTPGCALSSASGISMPAAVVAEVICRETETSHVYKLMTV